MFDYESEPPLSMEEVFIFAHNRKIDYILDMATNAIVAGGYDPAVLPEKSTSVKEGFTAVTVKLRDGTIEGLSGITRIGNVTVPETSENFEFQFSGKLGISQGKATYKYTASVSNHLLVSLDVVATIDQVGMEYEIETCNGCSMILTNFEITVGRIDVNIKGHGVVDWITSLVSNAIKGYIISVYKEEVEREIQKALDDFGPWFHGHLNIL